MSQSCPCPGGTAGQGAFPVGGRRGLAAGSAQRGLLACGAARRAGSSLTPSLLGDTFGVWVAYELSGEAELFKGMLSPPL